MVLNLPEYSNSTIFSALINGKQIFKQSKYCSKKYPNFTRRKAKKEKEELAVERNNYKYNFLLSDSRYSFDIFFNSSMCSFTFSFKYKKKETLQCCNCCFNSPYFHFKFFPFLSFLWKKFIIHYFYLFWCRICEM